MTTRPLLVVAFAALVALPACNDSAGFATLPSDDGPPAPTDPSDIGGPGGGSGNGAGGNGNGSGGSGGGETLNGGGEGGGSGGGNQGSTGGPEGGAPVPEPGTLFLLGSGLAAAAGVHRRRRRRAIPETDA